MDFERISPTFLFSICLVVKCNFFIWCILVLYKMRYSNEYYVYVLLHLATQGIQHLLFYLYRKVLFKLIKLSFKKDLR